MLETDQKVPEFLAHHIPDGEDLKTLKFESENELGGFADEVEGAAWGAEAGGDDAAAADAWGSSAPAAEGAAGGWGAAPVAAPEAASGGWGAAPAAAPSGW